uniref:Uncharacterized protein n=1 Tax=Avena sativa TaxID=4498 RepID=A0ACD5Z1G0_AVESA
MACIVSKIARAAFATRASPAAVGGIAYGGRPAAASSVSPADAIHISPAGGSSYYEEQRFRSESEVLPHVDESVLKSDEAMWAFYEHWCKFHGISRDRREMARRFKIFSNKARAVYKFNSSGGDGKIGMTQFADWTKEETMGLRGCPVEKNGLSFF